MEMEVGREIWMGRREGRETFERFGSTGRRTLCSLWSQVEILGQVEFLSQAEILGRSGNKGRRILWHEVELSRLWQWENRWRRRWRRLERSTSGLRGSEMRLPRRERSKGRCLRKRRMATCLRNQIERGKEQRAALA